MDREQIEALRRQVEEDYKLDLAAIERLQRRYLGNAAAASGSAPVNSSSNGAPVSTVVSQGKWSEEAEPRVERRSQPRIESAIPLPASTSAPDWQRDELEGSIRTMFNGGRPVGR
jgi:hypothetical protein